MTRVYNGALRGLLAALLVATPSLLLPGVSPDTTEVVALVGLALSLLIWIEYAAHYPSLVEFRDGHAGNAAGSARSKRSSTCPRGSPSRWPARRRAARGPTAAR